MNAPKFDSHVVPGDSITIEKDGRTYVARIEFDQDTHIDDTDMYNEDQAVTGCTDEEFVKLLAARKAWLNDEWIYVGVIVELVCETCGQARSDSSAALWGVEANYTDGDDNAYLTEIANDLISEVNA
jgi:hypothetical protein